MNIKLNDEQMQSFVSKAILDGLTEENRTELLKGAIKELLTPKDQRNSYSKDKRTPLKIAFDDAVEQVTRDLARDLIQNDETLKSHIKEMLAEAIEKVYENKEETVKRIADNLAYSFARMDSY